MLQFSYKLADVGIFVFIIDLRLPLSAPFLGRNRVTGAQTICNRYIF